MKKVISIFLSTIIIMSITVGINITARADYYNDLSNAVITLSQANYTYNGCECKPAVTVMYNGYKVDTYCYDVKYYNNVNVGTASVVVSGDDDYYTGSRTVNFTITALNIKSKNCYVYDQEYNGKKKDPKVWVNIKKQEYDDYEDKYYTFTDSIILKNDRDYTVKYSGGNRKKIGKYTATINFKGNYSGSVKKTFKILPKSVSKIKESNLTTDSVKLSWSESKKCTGYKIYRWSDKKYKLIKTTKSRSLTIKRANKYDSSIDVKIVSFKKVGRKTFNSYGTWHLTNLLPEKVDFKVSKADFGEFVLTMDKSSDYQIQVSKNSSFSRGSGWLSETSTYKSYGSTHKFYKFASGVKFYIRVREYKYINGKLKAGPWSKTKTVTPY